MLLKKYCFYCFVLFVFACNNPINNGKPKDISAIVTEKYNAAFKEALDSITSAKQLIKNGDLVCRTGFDFVSQSLQNFNTQDKSYSHSGIAFVEDGKVFVYHSIAGQDENPDECFMKEPFDSFVNPTRKVCFGIYRYKISDSIIACVYESFKDMVKRKVKFDKMFDLKDDEKQYCSEAIAKTLKKCSNGQIIIPTTVKQNMPNIKSSAYKHLVGKRFEYIALDNLYLNPFCDSIKKVVYKIGYAKPN